MKQETTFSDLTFIGGESRLARFFARPAKQFLAIEAAGGVMLLLATAAALIWINSPWGDTYDSFWEAQVDLSVAGTEIFQGHSLVEFVNDALMALFFFVVGLEIKGELVNGQLQSAKAAALPAFAALGGMVLPALLYFSITSGSPAVDGWGIPMATDIAFAIGIVSLLGNRISRRLKVFLLSLAIVDDIGAIIVIALFYSAGIDFPFLFATVALLAVVYLLQKLKVWYIPIYVLIGVFIWWTTFRSGVHATIAGVALGLMAPARPLQSQDETRTIARWLRDKPEVFPVDVRYASFHIRESVSVAERLETAMHPITSYAIIPIFALANAGVRLNGTIIADAFQANITWGIIIGLVVGKTIGITTFTLLATRLGLADRPRALTFRNLVGLSMIAGIGFTVSLFVSGLAFSSNEAHGGEEVAAVVIDAEPATNAGDVPDELAFAEAADDHGDEGETVATGLEDDAKIGILFASVIASIGGLLILGPGNDGADD